MSDTVITVDKLGKKYSIRHERDQRYVALRDVIAEKAKNLFRRNGKGRTTRPQDQRQQDQSPVVSSQPPAQSGLRPGGLSGGPPSKEDFWALRDVSFEVRRGEVLGIIGRNGAGKSTLLKILSRITDPTEGRVRIRGRVASLLEVGTGFHPELTGRENIFLNGAVLGMTRAEIKSKFDEIVAFAETEKFLDTPVKRYSSGMYVRLAFAVAAHLEPEILVVDEVLAVGDAGFQKKCLGKMELVAKEEGRTVLFVSHNMQTVRQLCGRTVLLAGGRKLLDGESGEVVQAYLRGVSSGESLSEISRVIAQFPPDPAFRLSRVNVVQDGQSSADVVSGKPLEIVIEYEVFEEVSGLHVYFLLCDVDGTMLFESLHNGDDPDIPTTQPGKYISRATIPADFLAGRSYDLRINAAIHRVRECIPQPSPINIKLNVAAIGRVNSAYPGYVTPGKLAPLFHWHTDKLS